MICNKTFAQPTTMQKLIHDTNATDEFIYFMKIS